MAEVEVSVSAAPAAVGLGWPDGDTVAFTLSFVDGLSAPIDLSAHSFAAVMRRTATAAQSWPFTVDVSGAVGGVIVLTTPVATDLPSVGVWDLEQTAAGAVVSTLVSGSVTLRDTVT